MKKLHAFFCNLEEFLCASIFLIMVGAAFINVIARYIPGVSFASSEDLIVNLFVWLTMLGASVAVKQKAHISITLLTKKIPEKYHKIILFIQWISVLTLFSIIIFFSTVETWSELKIGMTTTSLGLPLGIFTLALPAGSLLILIHFSFITFKELKGLE